MSIRYLGNKVRRLCAVIVGLVFFVAGILKLMDPVGSMLIVREYFSFLHLSNRQLFYRLTTAELWNILLL